MTISNGKIEKRKFELVIPTGCLRQILMVKMKNKKPIIFSEQSLLNDDKHSLRKLF